MKSKSSIFNNFLQVRRPHLACHQVYNC